MPDRKADHEVTYATRADQALLYRLSGDRNPLHSDPEIAKFAGFDRPILHGLCTYGVTGRALLHELCGSDVAKFGSMDARFSKPVMPGDTLTVRMWDDGAGTAIFQTVNQDGVVVIDGGRFDASSRRSNGVVRLCDARAARATAAAPIERAVGAERAGDDARARARSRGGSARRSRSARRRRTARRSRARPSR